MIRLLGRRLIIPRGDTGSFSIPTIGEIGPSDIAIFGIFDSLTHKTLVMKKIEATKDYLTIFLNNEDTIDLEPRKYNWDITIYKDPIYDEDEEIIGASEINSYYSAFKLPICEITEVVLDMDINRRKTSTLTLNINNYQAANNIQTVYPWENIQRSQLSKQIYEIAKNYGYNKEEEEFWNRFTKGILVLDSFTNFPIDGKEDTLYFDKDTSILYYFKIIEGEINEEMLQAINAVLIETIEEEEIIKNKVYIPVKTIPIQIEEEHE